MAHGSRLPNNQVRWVVTVVTDQAGVSVEGATPVLSPDGSKVAFASARPDLVPGDTNGQVDIFIQNLATGAVTRVPIVAVDGSEVNGGSLLPVFSPDGTKLGSVSAATNLVPDDTKSGYFVKDLSTGELQRVGTGFAYAATSTFYAYPSSLQFSPDNSKVVFSSLSADLVLGDTNHSEDIFVTDLTTGVVRRISVAQDGAQDGHHLREERRAQPRPRSLGRPLTIRRLSLQRGPALGRVDAAVVVGVAAREVAVGLGHELGRRHDAVLVGIEQQKIGRLALGLAVVRQDTVGAGGAGEQLLPW